MQSKGFYSGLKYEEIEFDPNVNPALFDRLVNLDVEGVITRGEAEIVKEQSIIDNVISKSFQISIPDEGTFLATFSDHPDIRSQVSPLSRPNRAGSHFCLSIDTLHLFA